MLGRGAMTRAKFMRIVGIDSISDGGEAAPASEGFHFVEQLVLAVITTVGIVGDVERILKLFGGDEFVAQSIGGRKLRGIATIVLGKTRRKRRDREGAMAERLICGPGEKGGIGSARECNKERIEGPEG